MKMRSEKDMLHLIVTVAQRDERIRAVIMNGSRVNSAVRKDPFQDYDIIYIVKDMELFIQDHSWVDVFGERMIMQLPDDTGALTYDRFAYLMQFKDGNRIDLTLLSATKREVIYTDSLSVVLLDKDTQFSPLLPPSNKSYWVQPPTETHFRECCNEFWWCMPYVAKGLWRNEITYAKNILEHPLRNMLHLMLDWYVGLDTNFQVSTGKSGKHLQQYLAPDVWEQVLKTYSDAEALRTWQAVFTMCDLFSSLARKVGAHFSFFYNEEEEKNVLAHLRYVSNLSSRAEELYP